MSQIDYHDPHTLFADISNWDPSFNAHAYASAGHKVIAIKATEDTGYVNPNWAAWAHAAHAAGLGVIHYHFCRPENGNPTGQADHFWNTAREHYLKGRDRLVYDLETGTPGEGAGWIQQADRRLRSINGGEPGDQPIGYTFLSYYNEGQPRIANGAWWIAAWGTSFQERRDLGGGQWLWAHQYTDGRGYGPGQQFFAGVAGSSPGGACDGNVINRRSVNLIEQALRKAPLK